MQPDSCSVGFYGSYRAPSTTAMAPPEGALNSSKWFAGQHSSKLPSAGCKLTTVVTESDVSRWAASFDSDATGSLDDVVERMFPDVSAAVLRLETASDVSKLCPITPFSPAAASSRTNAKQLAHRSKWIPYRKKIPVYQQRSAIVASIRDARVISVIGGPHSGKSTQVPQLLAETDMFRRKRIIVATSTAMSAVLLAKRLREEKGDTAPAIAHCIPVSTECTDASQIVVCTYDVLYRSLLCDVRMFDVGCVVLDDLHVHNSLYMDLCLAALRDLIAHPTANKDLRLVLNCRDDTVEGAVLQFLQPSLTAASKFERHLIPDNSVASSTAVMYLDDAIQWLQKVDAANGSATLVHDPASELGDVANHVQVLARVLECDAAGELIKSNAKGLDGYWLPLIQQLVCAYDTADVVGHSEAHKNAVVIILPSAEMCSVVHEYLRASLAESSQLDIVPYTSSLSPEAMLDAESRLWSALAPPTNGASTANVLRAIVLTTPAEVVNSTLMPFKNFGCLIDTCRQDRLSYDSTVEADRWTVGETISKATMRHHRLILHSDSGASQHSMSIQLLSRQTLHSQRTKQSAPHPATIAPLEALLSVVSHAYLRTKQHHASTNGATIGGASMGLRITKTISSFCWDMNSNQLRGDAWQRAAQHAESWLQHMGALDAKFALTGLGAWSLSLGLPWQVSRLLLFGALFSPNAVHTTLLAALWLVGDVFDDRNASAKDLGDARSFFLSSGGAGAGDALSIPFNAFCMWRRTVSQTPAEEQEFLHTAHLSRDNLVEAQRVQLAILHRMRQIGLCSGEVCSAESIDKSLCDQGDDASNAALWFCAGGALHPNVVYHHNGAMGFAKVVENSTPSLFPVAVIPRCGLTTKEPVQVTLSKVCAPSASHVQITACGAASLPAAVICCGVGVRQPLAVPSRCRGWMSPLTNVWRQTNAARHLPPPPQIAARTVPLKLHNPARTQPVLLELDGVVNVQASATTAALLAKIRDFSKRKLAALISLKESKSESERNMLHEVLLWLEQRQATQEDFLRDRRQHITADETPGAAILQPYLTLAESLERPTLVVQPVAQHPVRTTPGSVNALTTESPAHAMSTSLTFTGTIPPDQATQALIRRTAETIGRNASRDGEASFTDRQNFAFLRPDHAYHEYYLHILKKEAPHLDWLGDDLVELELWLQQLEVQVEKECDAAQQQPHENYSSEQQGTFDFSGGYEEVSEEQYAAEVQRQREAEEAQRKAANEEEGERQKQAAAADAAAPFVPKPGSTFQFLSPDASAQGVGSGTLHGGNTLLQSLMAMRSVISPKPDGAAETSLSNLTGPAAASASSVFGCIPGSQPAPPATDNLSAQELLAIIGGGGDASSSTDGNNNNNNFFLGMMQQNMPALKPHPLTIPPPPLPSEALACRMSSVIVEPLPSATGMNLPLVLAKALGETLDMKVGPTLIVGDVARIEVPSSSVETRAIALKHFYCLGSKLTISKNDRIIDNPNRVNNRILELKERLHGGRGRGGGSFNPAPYADGPDGYRGRGRGGRGRGRGGSTGLPREEQVTSFVPATVGAGYLQPPSHLAQPSTDTTTDAPPPPSAPVRATGAFTDSDEE